MKIPKEESISRAKYEHWIREFNRRIPYRKHRKYSGIAVREMEGQKMIKYLRHLEKIGHFAGRNPYLRAAVYRKLKQYKDVEWDNFGVPIKPPKKNFNYWEKLYPDLYI